jgi:parallel beta-helix repeat protein
MNTDTKVRRTLGALLAAAAFSLALTLGTQAAKAVQVSCGETITADTTLDSDLVDCPNNGIVIGADRITLDLNGHTVDGNGKLIKKCPKNEPCDLGLVNDGHDGVTVRNGSVREFATGVFVGRARQNRVLGIASSRNDFFGIVLAESARSLVRDSSGSNSPAPDGDGLGLFASHDIRILNNSFRRNAQLGIHVVDSHDNLINGNLFFRNADFGILMEGDRNQVRGNRCVRNGTCVIVAPGNRNVIARNRLSRDGSGIGIEKGRGNLVTGNVIVRARRQGIYLGLNEPAIGGVGTVVRGNVVRGSGADAFTVREADDRSLLRGNVARGAGDDGFDIENTSTRVTRNRAVRNADLGIEAVFGVIDGGGNKARGNGNALQCSNVFCL